MTRIAGWILILVGLLVFVFSQKIVFPGLERLLGIETIVGKSNVVYQPDGTYIYTNPGAMILWVAAVGYVGMLICFVGGLLLYFARRAAREVSDRSIHKHAA